MHPRNVILVLTLGVLILSSIPSLSCGESNVNSSNISMSDNSTTNSIVEKPVGPPATAIPVDKWPSIPYPPLGADIPPPGISGNVMKIIGTDEVSYGATSLAHLALFIENAGNRQPGRFNLRITFDPSVISIAIQSRGDYLGDYLSDTKVDNAPGVVELTVNPFPRNFTSGWLELGRLIFTAVGKPGDSSDLHLIITSPVDNLTAIDGFVRIKPKK